MIVSGGPPFSITTPKVADVEKAHRRVLSALAVKTVAEHVEGDDDEDDERARVEGLRRMPSERGLQPDGDRHAPVRSRRLHAEPEEGDAGEFHDGEPE